MSQKISERFRYPWVDSGGAQAPLGINMVFVSKSVPKKSVRNVEVCLDEAFKEAHRRDMTEVYAVDEALQEQIKRQEKIRNAISWLSALIGSKIQFFKILMGKYEKLSRKVSLNSFIFLWKKL